MTPEQRKKHGAIGGKEAHLRGWAHKFAKGDDALVAGHLGGKATVKKYGKDYMKKIGQRGGAVTSYAKEAAKDEPNKS